MVICVVEVGSSMYEVSLGLHQHLHQTLWDFEKYGY